MNVYGIIGGRTEVESAERRGSGEENRRARRTVDLVLIVTEDDDWRRSLLQALEKVDHLGFLLNVLNFL